MGLVAKSYWIAGLLPRSELYGPKSQIQRAAGSIPANMAEGHERDHLHHLSIVTGSVAELENRLLVAARLALVNNAEIARCLDMSAEVSKMLAGLIKSLRHRQLAPGT
jgi:four helix bundle protein